MIVMTLARLCCSLEDSLDWLGSLDSASVAGGRAVLRVRCVRPCSADVYRVSKVVLTTVVAVSTKMVLERLSATELVPVEIAVALLSATVESFESVAGELLHLQ